MKSQSGVLYQPTLIPVGTVCMTSSIVATGTTGAASTALASAPDSATLASEASPVAPASEAATLEGAGLAGSLGADGGAASPSLVDAEPHADTQRKLIKPQIKERFLVIVH